MAKVRKVPRRVAEGGQEALDRWKDDSERIEKHISQLEENISDMRAVADAGHLDSEEKKNLNQSLNQHERHLRWFKEEVEPYIDNGIPLQAVGQVDVGEDARLKSVVSQYQQEEWRRKVERQRGEETPEETGRERRQRMLRVQERKARKVFEETFEELKRKGRNIETARRQARLVALKANSA